MGALLAVVAVVNDGVVEAQGEPRTGRASGWGGVSQGGATVAGGGGADAGGGVVEAQGEPAPVSQAAGVV
jgi:hypothetical protein